MEETTEVESAEVPVPQPEPEEDYSAVEFQGLPEIKEGDSYKGMKPITEYAKLHPDIAKHYKNLQGAKTKAEQRASNLEKELARLKAEYGKQKEYAYQQVKGLEKNIYNEDGTLKQFDTHTDEGYDAYIKAQTQKAIIEANKAFAEQYEKEQKAERQQRTADFVEQHKEFEDVDFFDAVLEKMEKIPGLLMEDAYAICVRNYKPKPDQYQQAVQKSNQTIDNREAIFAMGGPARVAKVKPDYSSAKKSANPMEEIYRIQKELGLIKG